MRIVLLTVLVWCQIFCMPVNSQQRPMRGASPYADVLIEGVPHVKQKPDFCGEACAEMYLRKLGYQIDQDMVYEQSGLDPLAGRGCHTNELVRALKKIGFSVGDVWSKVDVGTSGAQLESAWSRLHGDLTRGVPSIVCMRYDDRPKTTEHFRLILGYDSRKDEVIYHEPARASAGYRRMSRARFLDLWPLKYAQREWTLIRLRLASKRKLEVPARARKGRFTQAQYAHHVIALKKKLPGPGFTILLEPPFVVVGDEAAGVVKRRALSTVRWAVTRLKSAYFKKDPKQIIDIWLFKDRRSYLSNVKKLFNDTPGTPFGYYSATHRALVMNISTGGGTLVHEIVHPFIESNFPGCPAWFNEGLASLYEQCGERNGRIHGFTNWRLAGLQKAIRAKGVPTFKALTATTENEFYNRDPGTNYSQARYLCYYLQHKGLLVSYYRQFSANRAKDPTGYKTLQKVLGEKEMAGFQKRWEAWVLKLVYR